MNLNHETSLIKNLLISLILALVIFFIIIEKVNALDDSSIFNKSELISINKYAEQYCIDKDNHIFEGLENEKTLKYTYYRYITFKQKELLPSDINKFIINKIKEKCYINKQEEIELYQFFLNESDYNNKNNP